MSIEPLAVSVLIPTHRRPAALARCLAALARQTPDAGEHEIVVGFDGPDPEGAMSARRAWHDAGGRPGRLRVVAGPRRGYIDVRHRLLPTLRGRLVVSLNDDVVPVPGFLAAHERAHEELAAAGRRAIIVGDSRFAPVPAPTLLDAALDRTGMIFFWHAMLPPATGWAGRADAAGENRGDDGAGGRGEAAHGDPRDPGGSGGHDPDHDWGHRHCYGLNMSVLREELAAAGGMPSLPDTYGYDDVELGWRLARRGLPTLLRPAAAAPHEHRYRAAAVLRREFSLGRAAVRYAHVNPAFTAELFGRDILAPDEAAWSREFLERERADLRQRRERFLGFDRRPAAEIGEAMLPLACALVADHARSLRRACWCEGMLAEREAPVPEDLQVTPPAQSPVVVAEPLAIV